jgi:hypothetical protein
MCWDRIMKYINLMMCVCSLVCLSISAEEKVDVRKIEDIYAQAFSQGIFNEYVRLYHYGSTLLNIGFVTNEIHSIVEQVLDIYVEHYENLEALCYAYPDEPCAQHILQDLEIYKQSFRRDKIKACFLLIQFGIGSLKEDFEQKFLQKTAIEYIVKHQIVRDLDFLDEESKKALHYALESKKLQEIQHFCSVAKDRYLQEEVIPEIVTLETLQGYWNKYTFHLSCVEQLTVDKESLFTTAVLRTTEHFLEKICEVKGEYQEFLGC